jgi:hypothetical protein
VNEVKKNKPGPYANDEILKQEIMRLAHKYGVPCEYIPQAMALGNKHIHEQTLKAAGSSITADDEREQVELWAIAHELGLSDEQYDRITPLAFLTLVERRFRSKLPEQPASSATNGTPSNWNKKPQNWRHFGNMLLAHRDWTNEQLCKAMDELKVLCPYAKANSDEGWASALEHSGEKIHKLIGRIRKWLGIRGRTQ